MSLKTTAENPVARMVLQSVIGLVCAATLSGVIWLGREIHAQNAHLSRLEMRATTVESARASDATRLDNLAQRTTVLEVQRAGDQALLSQQMTELRGVLAQVGSDMRALSTRLDTLRYGPEAPPPRGPR